MFLPNCEAMSTHIYTLVSRTVQNNYLKLVSLRLSAHVTSNLKIKPAHFKYTSTNFGSSRKYCTLAERPNKDAWKDLSVAGKTNINVALIGGRRHDVSALTGAIKKIQQKNGLDCNFVNYNNMKESAETQSETMKISEKENDEGQEKGKLKILAINANRFGYSTDKSIYTYTGCCDYDDYIKDMITGASKTIAIWNVTAEHYERAKAGEQLLVAKLTGVQSIIIFINKADAMGLNTLNDFENEVKTLLDECGYDSNKIPIIHGSTELALTENKSEYGEHSIQRLLDSVDSWTPNRIRDINEICTPFIMPIDKVLELNYRDTVIAGIIESGVINKDTAIMAIGNDGIVKLPRTSVIQVNKESVAKAQSGSRVALIIRNIPEDLNEGMLLCASNYQLKSNHFEALVYVHTKSEGGRSKPIFGKYLKNIVIGSHEWNCRLDIANEEFVMPGQHKIVRITFKYPALLRPGQRFQIKEYRRTETGPCARITVSGVILHKFPNVVVPHFNLKKLDLVL